MYSFKVESFILGLGCTVKQKILYKCPAVNQAKEPCSFPSAQICSPPPPPFLANNGYAFTFEQQGGGKVPETFPPGPRSPPRYKGCHFVRPPRETQRNKAQFVSPSLSTTTTTTIRGTYSLPPSSLNTLQDTLVLLLALAVLLLLLLLLLLVLGAPVRGNGQQTGVERQRGCLGLRDTTYTPARVCVRRVYRDHVSAVTFARY